MLTDYIRAAMGQATYEYVSDGTSYGKIPGFQDDYASAETVVEHLTQWARGRRLS